MRNKSPGLLLEEFTGQVMRCAGTGRPVVELARIFTGVLDERLDVRCVDALGVDHHHLRHVGHEYQRHKVFFDVVVELGVHRRRNGVMHGAHKQRVAIRRGLCRNTGTERSPSATAVINDEWPARQLGKLG